MKTNYLLILFSLFSVGCNPSENSVYIIGSADRPTAIYITNNIKAQELYEQELIWPTSATAYPDALNGFDNFHSIDTIYHKTIKYFNDDIYIEEDNNYLNADWDETIIRGI